MTTKKDCYSKVIFYFLFKLLFNILLPRRYSLLSLRRFMSCSSKEYTYTKDYKEQPREICVQCKKKSIQPVCHMQERLVCTYEP